MPLSSSEIAAMNGGFMQQSMMNQQYAGMIGQGPIYGAGGGMGGDHIMGGVMSRGSAIGGPLMSGAMGMMGLDPMSLGLRAGMGALGSGAGFGGAAMAGAGVALPGMAMMAGAQYAGSQMYTGAQQQQTMNNVLRQSFGFRNASGGQGFDRGQMSSIGSMVREMSHDFGPGGEVASMGELTQLAGKMGSMGFAQGVRDVKEFGQRFKEMVKTLKTMAQDLGTTLEGAMEFAQAAKGSGMFGMNRIQGFTSAARGASVAGGLALSEVTGAASIGSQISRSVGGLGRQGAMAGIRTIGQIGTAQQMGILSEEDIYNATGQTGAEGRQAFAASAMQRTAKFLQSGRGRRMLASMADKDGNLDEGRLQQFMTGGMGIGETMSADRAQLGKVGRANFIRNEGRLRGAALEKIGGFGDAMQLAQWASSKGIDINNMDDRSMLFAQRQLGMGRDEMDAAMKMVNNMPQIIESQRRAEADDGYFQRLAVSRKQRGVEGVKNRFEQAKEVINGKLQKVGQDIFNQGSEQIDEFMAKLTGAYVETYSKDVDDQYRALRSGGSGRAFGLGGGRAGATARQFATGGGIGGAGGPGLFGQMRAGSDMTLNQALAGRGSSGLELFLGGGAAYAGRLGQFLIGGQSDMSKLREAGFNMSGVTSDATAQAKLNSIQAMQRAAATGYNDGQVKMGASNGDWIRKAYARDEVTGRADQRMESFEKALMSHGSAEAKAAWASAKTPEQKAALMANLERGAGIKGEGSIANMLSLPEGLRGLETGRFKSTADENRAYAQALGGVKRSTGERVLGGALGGAAEAMLGIGNVFGGLGIATGAHGKIQEFTRGLAGRMFGTEEKEQAMGAFLKGAEGRNLISGLLTGDADSRSAARDQLAADLASGKKDDPTRETRQRMLDASDYYNEVVKNGGKPLSEAQKKAWEKANPGRSASEAEAALGGMVKVLDASQKRDLARAARRARDDANKEADKLSALGVYDAASGQLTTTKAAELSKMGKGALEYANAAIRQTNLERGLGGTEGSAEADRAIFGDIQGIGSAQSDRLAHMSVQQKRALAQAMGGEAGAEAGRSAAMEARLQSLSRRRGTAGAAASILGVEGLTKQQLAGMDLTGAGAGALLAHAGITDKDTVAQLQKGAKGGPGGLAEALRHIVESPEFREAQKKKQLDNQESQDPLQAAIRKNGERANQLLEKIARATGVSAEELAKMDKKDPEAK